MVRTPPGRFPQYCLDIKGIVVVNFLVRVIIFCFLPGLLPLTKIVVWIVENTAVTGRIKAVCVGLMRLTEK